MLSSTITTAVTTTRRGCCSSIKTLTSSSSSSRELCQISSRRYLSSSSSGSKANANAKAKATVVPRKNVTAAERAALRQARKQRASLPPKEGASSSSTGSSSSSSSSSSAGAGAGASPRDPRLVFGLAVGIPTLLLTWGVYDPNSPPAKIATALGFDEFAESFARPNEEKLLPNWHDMKDVPKDFQPMTLIIDLEDTLVNSTWDRKKG